MISYSYLSVISLLEIIWKTVINSGKSLSRDRCRCLYGIKTTTKALINPRCYLMLVPEVVLGLLDMFKVHLFMIICCSLFRTVNLYLDFNLSKNKFLTEDAFSDLTSAVGLVTALASGLQVKKTSGGYFKYSV